MIKLIVLDVDGVLTDGSIIYDENGIETKQFNVRDGLGIKLAQRAGIDVAIISGRPSKVTELRAKELGIEKVMVGIKDKAVAFEDLRKEFNVKKDECAAIGDDLNDKPMLRLAGLSATVGDAAGYMKDFVDYVTYTKGGDGAVREFIEHILQKDGHWDAIADSY